MSKDIRKENSKRRNRIPFVILSVVLLVVLGVVVALAMKGKSASQPVGDNTEQNEDSVEKWQEGTVSYEGKHYLYNNDIKTYLLMGIDSDEPAKATANHIEGGQSDAMFLLVTNPKNKKISVISINRNTMTRVKTCYDTGADAGYKTMQLCVQHGYGDGMTLSCERAKDAVSYLFYNLPIHGYLSMRMGAIPAMNDAVGGVEVTVLQDISNTSRGVELKKGETITLDGNQAYAYLRTRDIQEFESATYRLQRQEQYIAAYMSKLSNLAGQDTSVALDIYESIEDYIVSSIDFASLVSEVKDYEYSSENLYSVPGETKMGEVYEEFYVDEDAFYEMILDVFYEEVVEES
jgi:LCP family protein required for cell wall assembly